MIPPCLNLICQIGFPENQSGRKREQLTEKRKRKKYFLCSLAGQWSFPMNWVHCACSTFITAKITVLHQQIYPKRYCETRSLLFNPHTSLFSQHISTTLLMGLYLDLLCKHTFLTHTVILQSLMAHVLKMRGLRI